MLDAVKSCSLGVSGVGLFIFSGTQHRSPVLQLVPPSIYLWSSFGSLLRFALGVVYGFTHRSE